ncbi:MAG: hypothetical protein BJ554DRAFT_8399 [Olpidium bornovanus]|uniref:Uncharacterized protein n=1 Tax=Olpidium bornovanus TaxID=278681 RepID=A0A8H8DJ29_9FUNG|nr:MAG: hypothetical protein BJ554DRAFT_8399 [Olpidium bornovanus]
MTNARKLELTMTGIFSLYQAIVHAGCTFLLVIVTLGFKVYCDIGFGKLSEVIPLSSFEKSDKRPPPIVTDTGDANNNDESDNSSNADNEPASPNHGHKPESAAPISTGSLQRLWPRSSVESTNTCDAGRSGLPAGISTDTLDLDGTGVGSNWVAMWDKQEMHERIRNQTYRPTALVKRLPKRLWLPRDPTSMWKLEVALLKATVKIKSAPAVSFRDDHRDSPAEPAHPAAFSPDVGEFPEPWSGNSATGSKLLPDTVLVELGRDSVPSRGSTSEKLTARSGARRSHVSPSLSIASVVPAPFELGGPSGDREDDDDEDDEDPDDVGGGAGAEYGGNPVAREPSDRSPLVTSTPEIRSPSNERLLRSAPRSRPGGGGDGEGDHDKVAAAPVRRSGEVERLV